MTTTGEKRANGMTLDEFYAECGELAEIGIERRGGGVSDTIVVCFTYASGHQARYDGGRWEFKRPEKAPG